MPYKQKTMPRLEDSQSRTALGMEVNQGFIQDINLECTQLISKMSGGGAQIIVGTPRNSDSSMRGIGSIDQTEQMHYATGVAINL